MAGRCGWPGEDQMAKEGQCHSGGEEGEKEIQSCLTVPDEPSRLMVCRRGGGFAAPSNFWDSLCLLHLSSK